MNELKKNNNYYLIIGIKLINDYIFQYEKRMKKSKENLEREKLNKEIFEQIKKELKDKK